MRGMVIGLVLASGQGVAADTWTPLASDEITQALTGARVTYGTAWQEFRASGRTLYNAGQDSWGYWEARDDAYCSQWPPADGWACYKVERAGNRLRFIGDSGDVTEGAFE